MNRNTSIYLDVVRFAAALVVYMSHLDDWSGKYFAIFTPFISAQAVVIFFVLSGYVIAYATDQRELNWKVYTTNRAARIYSVAIPCLIFTFTVDALTSPLPNVHFDNVTSAGPTTQFICGIFFINEVWGRHVPIGSNAPYWSLGYEVPYYIFFGLIFYLPKRWKIAAILVATAFGPRVTLFAVLWFMGMGAYHATKIKAFDRLLAMLLLLISAALWAALIGLGSGTNNPLYWHRISDLPADFASAILFSVTIVTFDSATRGMNLFSPMAEKIIRWCAGGTFCLYLFHTPVARLTNQFSPLAINNFSGMLFVSLIVILSSFALAYITNKCRLILQTELRKILSAA